MDGLYTRSNLVLVYIFIIYIHMFSGPGQSKSGVWNIIDFGQLHFWQNNILHISQNRCWNWSSLAFSANSVKQFRALCSYKQLKNQFLKSSRRHKIFTQPVSWPVQSISPDVSLFICLSVPSKPGATLKTLLSLIN